MSVTRDNHYVPQWYQEGFFQPGRNSLAYLDMSPGKINLPDGRTITQNSVWNSTPTSRAFVQKDLYSTFFGTAVNDEIERRLFGDVDTRGSRAVRAFLGTDMREWHERFQDFFEFLDIQKIRTPKGLDWLRSQYPALTQNDLMLEMQGIRMLHCTIWSQGVREIVSAEDSAVKFITSDHPVTVYNHAVAPADAGCTYPNDPGIELRGSQTLYPMDRNHCLILTNLEYAKDTDTDPLQKRTFARNYRNSLTRSDAVIRQRKLTEQEVCEINFIVKTRARRYVAGGRKDWLYPEQSIKRPWSELRGVLSPPNLELLMFGGEIFVGYDSGDVHYQDEFGRTEKPREFLFKESASKPLRPNEYCGCGRGRRFKDCCASKVESLRPTWKELSIRERNLMLYDAMVDVLGLDTGKSWTQIRRDLTDERIGEVYHLYEALWPLETDLLSLLPKPDGDARAVYTGSIHPSSIVHFALAASLYFGEVIVAHPFVHPGVIKKEMSPTANPKSYRQEFLKSVVLFVNAMPLVDLGLVNLVPDPCDFDYHLRQQMMRMAQTRAPKFDPKDDSGLRKLVDEDNRRGMMLMPDEALSRMIREINPDFDEQEVERVLAASVRMREDDPLAVLQEGSLDGGRDGGQISIFKLAPNFEMTMYLAQAMGACIITDSPFRWSEIEIAAQKPNRIATSGLTSLAADLERSIFHFPQDSMDVAAAAQKQIGVGYSGFFQDLFRYLRRVPEQGEKPNREAQLMSQFRRMHWSAEREFRKLDVPMKLGNILSAMPRGGIQNNTVNRLLLMSGSKSHSPSVPAAFFMKPVNYLLSARS
ncbi:MAG: DUF4238 domain-containing protein [Rhizobiales bacterium]|nr:DUF4238 domain-containing protein [Hyphomicrobiales bacterium]